MKRIFCFLMAYLIFIMFSNWVNFLTRIFFSFKTQKKRSSFFIKKTKGSPHHPVPTASVQLHKFKFFLLQEKSHIYVFTTIRNYWQILSITWWPKDVVDFGCYFATHLSQTQIAYLYYTHTRDTWEMIQQCMNNTLKTWGFFEVLYAELQCNVVFPQHKYQIPGEWVVMSQCIQSSSSCIYTLD